MTRRTISFREGAKYTPSLELSFQIALIFSVILLVRGYAISVSSLPCASLLARLLPVWGLPPYAANSDHLIFKIPDVPEGICWRAAGLDGAEFEQVGSQQDVRSAAIPAKTKSHPTDL